MEVRKTRFQSRHALRLCKASEKTKQRRETINKITIIGLLVLDQDAAIEFYTQKLGFGLLEDKAFGESHWVTISMMDNLPHLETDPQIFRCNGGSELKIFVEEA
jgi:hypothetical protein